MSKQPDDAPMVNRRVRYGATATVFILTLSGFAQMPIFKRYYIADIPGLGWLAEFYVTHYMHYIGAALLIGLAAYMLVDYLLVQRKFFRLTRTGILRALLLAWLIVTGGLLVIRNFPGPHYSAGWIIALDVVHLGLVVVLLAVSLICAIFQRQWTTAR